MTKPIPDGFNAITPYLIVSDADKAMAFYAKAFGATEVVRMPGPDGHGVMHAEISIGGSMVMLTGADPASGMKSPTDLGGSPVTIHHYCADVDAAFARATGAGAAVVMPPADMFWGDRFAQVRDPFGHIWNLATHKRDLTPEQIAKGMKAFFASMPKPG
jgi:uncharacterized glyoxalase superfamily protein PhnB